MSAERPTSPPTRRRQSLALAMPILAAGALLFACSGGDAVIELRGHTMGTTYSVKVSGRRSEEELASLQAAISERLERVNALMSTYLPDSELSRFNAATSTDWFPVSDELAGLVEEAHGISLLSGGAFDVTVGPIVNLWGFGPDEVPPGPPDEAAIEAASERTGYRKLDVRRAPPALRKSRPDIYVDLSAIAKGYGVDQLADLLERNGIDSYLVEIGGEVRGRGLKPGGEPWRVAVEVPDPAAREVYRVITLGDAAMATSGDYRNFYERDGRRYSHTIDPATGRPVTHALASVTVIDTECARADALATALLVLGPDRGLALAESGGIAALLITREGDTYRSRATSALATYVNGGTGD